MNQTNSSRSLLESTIDVPSCFVTVFGVSDTGRVREHNEDNFILADLTARISGSIPEIHRHRVGRFGSLFMVADGMGGGAAGEVASQLAVQNVYERFTEGLRNFPELDKYTFAQQLKRAVEYANSVIHGESIQRPEFKGMGTTTSAAGVFRETLFVAQIGDSRAYLIRNGAIKQITKDQSLVNKLLDAGLITEEEAETHENKNVILQALGVQEKVEVIVSTVALRQEDTLILCSDGLSGLVKAEEILQIADPSKNPETACHELIALANQRGGFDNITVIIARFRGSALPLSSPGNPVQYEVLADASDETSPMMPSLEANLETKELPITPPSVSEPKKKKNPLSSFLIVGAIVLVVALAVLLGVLLTPSNPTPIAGSSQKEMKSAPGTSPPENAVAATPTSSPSLEAQPSVSPAKANEMQNSKGSSASSSTPPLSPQAAARKQNQNGGSTTHEAPAEGKAPLPSAKGSVPEKPVIEEPVDAKASVEFRLSPELANLIQLDSLIIFDPKEPKGTPASSPAMLPPGDYPLNIRWNGTDCRIQLTVKPAQRNLFTIRKDATKEGPCNLSISATNP